MDERTNRLIFHFIAIVFFIVSWRGVLELGNTVRAMGKTHERLQTRFLTNWNFGIQTILFCGYFLYDILELIGLDNRPVRKMKQQMDFHFYSINAPMSIFVAVVFWGMCFYDKLLIFPVGLEKIMPAWVNHSLHTIIVPNVIIQAYFNKVSSVKLRKALIWFTIFNLFYFICVYGTFFETDIWVYPFLSKIVEPYRMLALLSLFVLSCLINVVFHFSNIWYCNRCTESLPPIKPQRGAQRKKQK